ncbi:efflux RND transporter periplasmic adaptor subunit [Fusibacter ferrireducens]|uniref:Efflux RND transporter periplasmic adaptor subunit n=1 Tax=Fusibacter ferrireducens TaxID=2785058 RepID=A0ABR9ZS26_9FIRM|nr:efflux RND transporter periplasmic adaptor subunit [Fusibacter ferrireducens]MBF4692715.1 efflux RND transporter periplasmic adaptor subunit [Fusibacter ferrireducens]
MKINKKWIIIGVAIIAIIAVIVMVNPKPGKKSEQFPIEMGLKEQTATTVSSEKVVSGDIDETVFTIGSVNPVETFNVMVKTPGDVKATYFEIGDHVNKDDVLFEINQDAFDVSKNQTLTQQKNALDQSKDSLKQAEDAYNDQKKLFESGAIAQSALDNTKSALENAQRAYENTKAAYNSTLTSLNEQLDNYIQRSPTDGIVVGKNISKDIYATSQNGYTIIPESQFIVNASVTSKYVKSVKKGQKASIYVNTLDKTYDGEVISVSEVGQQGTYPIELSIQGDDDLMSGLYSEVKITTHRLEQVPVISKKALLLEGSDHYVFRIKADNTVEKILVTTGAESDEKVEILQNLSLGDSIVVLGKEYLSENDKIVIK